MTDWKDKPKNLIMSTGHKNEDAWWYVEKNHISIWTSKGSCIGRIYFHQLRRATNEGTK